MASESQPTGGLGRRVLVLAVPDALDTALALSPDENREPPHFLSCTGAVDGALECVSCGSFELATAAHDVAAAFRPTHLVVRDRSGDGDDLERCRSFLEGALAGAATSVRCVIQTHPRPRAPSTSRYDAWLKRDAGIRPGRSVDIVWHEPLTTMYLDCRGAPQYVDDERAWQHVPGPARTIVRRLRDAAPHNLEYTTTRNA